MLSERNISMKLAEDGDSRGAPRSLVGAHLSNSFRFKHELLGN